MKISYCTLALTLTCLLGGGVSARDQDADAVVASVPFEFVAGTRTSPRGRIQGKSRYSWPNRELDISGYNKENVFVLPVAFDDGPTNQPTLSFEHVGGKYFLSKIRTLGGVYTMYASPEMVTRGKADTPSPSTSSASGSH